MSPAMLYNLPLVVAIAALAEVTADGNGAGVDTTGYDGVLGFVFDAKNIGGTTPTLACKLQHSDDDVDGHYADVVGGTFTGRTGADAAPQVLHLQRNALKAWVRLVDDIGGTSSPKYARSCHLMAHLKRS